MTIDKTKKKVGRPTDYNQELANLICERVATHAIGLKRLCGMFDDMPCEDTINQWRFKFQDFSVQYALAKVHQAELLADSMHDLANEISTYQDSDGNTRIDSGSVNAQRLKIDTIKFTVSKLLPKVYGNKDDAFVNLQFPRDVKDANTLLPMATEIFRALSSQEITPGQAKVLLATLKDYSSSIAIIDLNQKMSALLGETPNHTTIEGE